MKKNGWNRTLVALLASALAIGLDTGCDAKTGNAVAQLAPVVAQVAAAALGSGGNAGNTPFPSAPKPGKAGQGGTDGILLAAVDSIGRTGGASPGPAAPSTDTGGSVSGQKIAEVASGYVGMSDFPYAAGTNGGRKGCAQVVSTILKDAGVVDSVQLGVLDVLSDLRGRGWTDVEPPPWHDGDVVTWATYDRDGDGVNDPDTHIGIIKMVDGEPWAINNSSSQLQPVMKELAAMPYPVSHVLRGS